AWRKRPRLRSEAPGSRAIWALVRPEALESDRSQRRAAMGHRPANRRASRAPFRALGTLFAPDRSVLGPGRAGLQLPAPHRPGGRAAQHSRRDRVLGGAKL